VGQEERPHGTVVDRAYFRIRGQIGNVDLAGVE
jgi:hypothetical protein